MNFQEFMAEMRRLGIRVHFFRKNVNFVHWKNGFELEVSREFFPKHGVTSEQLQDVIKDINELLVEHPKQVNFNYRW